MRILTIEDDENLANMLYRGLSEEGYSIDWAKDGEIGLAMALKNHYDCILLDLMLPKLDGISLCRQLRENNRRQPVIMLTVKSTVEDKVEGLSAGADDYIIKPFSFEELLARIHAQIRRSQVLSNPIHKYKDLILNPVDHTATRGDKLIKLTSKEYALLDYLVSHSNSIVTEKELIENVWGLNFDPQTNVINVYLHHLRNKIDKNFSSPLIHTIRGQGYKLEDKP